MKRQWPLILCVFALLCGATTAAAQTNDADKITVLQIEVRKLLNFPLLKFDALLQ